MKKILILLPSTFLKRDYDRFGIELLKKNFHVKILDFSSWLRPDLWKEIHKDTFKCEEYVLINNKEEFLNFNSFSESLIIFDFLGNYPKSDWIREQLRNKKNVFFGFDVNSIPEDKIYLADLINKFGNLITTPKFFIKYIFKFFKDKFYKVKYIFVPDVVVAGGLKSFKSKKSKTKIKAHSMDYDIYLKLKNKLKKNKEDYAVFLDQDLNTHPDYKIFQLNPPASEKNYYPLLCNFLKNFKTKTGLNIKFAVHPKSRNKNLDKLLKGIDYSIGNTAELIKDSSLVFLHSTTAVSFAILFEKPIVVLTTEELNKSWLGTKINRISKLTNAKIINMNKDYESQINLVELSKINQSKYKNYIDSYVKVPNSPDIPLWEIVSNYLKNY